VVDLRKTNTARFFTAFAVTCFIFLLGLMLGLYVESQRIHYLSEVEKADQLNYDSLQLEYLYLSQIDDKSGCGAFTATLNNAVEDLEFTRTRLEEYLQDSSSRREEFLLLKREYTLSQLNYWLLSSRTKKLCETDYVIALYFHSKACGRCNDQGFILTYLKKVFGERVLIFALDSDFELEPMVGILKDSYNVTETPTIIVGGEKLEGFQGKDELLEVVCSKFMEKPAECE